MKFFKIVQNNWNDSYIIEATFSDNCFNFIGLRICKSLFSNKNGDGFGIAGYSVELGL